MRWLLAVLIPGLAAGCTSVFRSDVPPDQIYLLRPAPGSAVPHGNPEPQYLAATLQVARPQANPGLESDRIIVVDADRRMNFFSASRWPGELPELVEALAVETFRGSGAWAAVHDSRSPFPADYFLETTIRHFEADYTGSDGAPRVRVTLDCSIGHRADRRMIASFVAEGTAPAATNRMGSVIEAFERATQAALASAAERTVQEVRRSTAPSPP